MKKILILFLLPFTTYAIRNGIDTSLKEGVFPNAVMVQSIGVCSGHRITFNRVITATHCIEKPYSRARNFKVSYLDGNDVRVEKVSYSKVSKYSSDLTREISIFNIRPKAQKKSYKQTRILNVSRDESTLPESVFFVGFGVTSEAGNSDKSMRFGKGYFYNFKDGSNNEYLLGFSSKKKTFKLEAVDGYGNVKGKGQISLLEDVFEGIETNGMVNQVACKGDSGGPVYAKTSSGEFLLVGIQSHSVLDGVKFSRFKKMNKSQQCKEYYKSYSIPISLHTEFLKEEGVSFDLYDTSSI